MCLSEKDSDLREQNQQKRENWDVSEKTIQDQRETINSLKSQRDEILNSRSWRLIEKVRNLIDLLTGRNR